MGYVGQDVFLFHSSIEDNIRINDQTINRDTVRLAAQNAGLDDFIMELPDGYDTMVGDRGVMLSGGQRQRISIARALIKNPDILVLDEATSALDKETASHIIRSVVEFMRGKTVIVITHKDDFLKHADNIYHLKNGEIKHQ